jgi:hypothetical protein
MQNLIDIFVVLASMVATTAVMVAIYSISPLLCVLLLPVLPAVLFTKFI